MAIELWPALGKTVLDHNGDTITTAGISLATLTEYYSDLVVAGSLVTFDPLDADDPTVAIPTGTITLAKLANGTPGNLISYAANGTPVAVATGTAAQVLTSNGAGLPPTFQAASSGGAPALPIVVHNSSDTVAVGTVGRFDIVGFSTATLADGADDGDRIAVAWVNGSGGNVNVAMSNVDDAYWPSISLGSSGVLRVNFVWTVPVEGVAKWQPESCFYIPPA